MEEGGKADHIHIRVLVQELAQPLHGMGVGLGLAHIKGDLRLRIFPVVDHRVIHIHRVPHNVGQKADGVLVEGHSTDHHIAALPIITPVLYRHRRTGGAVHHFPPTLNIIISIHLQHCRVQVVHQVDLQRVLHRRMERGHNVHLLHLVRVRLGPGVVLAGGAVGGVDLGAGVFQLLGELCAVAVTQGVCAPALHNFFGLGHHIQVGGDGDSALSVCHSLLPQSSLLSAGTTVLFTSFILPWLRLRLKGTPGSI